MICQDRSEEEISKQDIKKMKKILDGSQVKVEISFNE